MRTSDIPTCIVDALSISAKQGGLTDDDYHLAGAGRAIAFVRMSAEALDSLNNDQRVAEYHAYCGISAARTAIDATASWLRLELEVDIKSLSYVDLKKDAYREKILGKRPDLGESVEPLSQLASEIDQHRQRAQHREGLALIFHSPGTVVVHAGGWYLAPDGLSRPRSGDIHLVDMLQLWATNIENRICWLLDSLGTTSC